MTFVEQSRQFGSRLLFVMLMTAIAVFFSEKVYWYPQGYVLWGLLMFYAVPVYACLWAIEHFRVQRLSALILVAALFAFLVEGVITPVIYEAGLFDPVMPFYFVGWHGWLSIIWGWYYLRVWLVRAEWRKLLLASTLFGSFWGAWSITFWLPEQVADWPQLEALGEAVTRHTQWPTLAFGLYTLTFTGMLVVSHWVLGQGGWQRTFTLSNVEKGLLIAILIFFFATLALPVSPLGIFKLVALLGVLFLALRSNRQIESAGSLLTELGGVVKPLALLGLLAMPAMATAVYALALELEWSEATIRALLDSITLLQVVIGGMSLLWAWVVTLWPAKPPVDNTQIDLD
ncbi:MAG: hypothetical protein AAGH78_09005 [Cyanobacteria bacterium P01_H01_bin.58]